jgi:hypothetical protein
VHAYRSLPTKCAPWFASIIKPCCSTLKQVPYMAGPPSSHVILILHVTLCIHLDLLSKRISSLITPLIDSVWKFLPGWRMSPLTLGHQKVLFPFWAPTWVVEPRGSSNQPRYNQSHEAQFDSTRWDVTHAPKGKLHEGPGSFPPFNCPYTRYHSCYSVNASFIVSCAPPPFINLGTIFLLRGKGCNTPCYRKLNQVN